MTQLVRTRAEFAAARMQLSGKLGLVPTMGALHAGHRALLGAARVQNDAVMATVFVNPLQFGPGEDLARYPRNLDADLEVCQQAGVALVWAPTVDEVYARGPAQVTVSAGPLGNTLEGALRPGHFDGVLTVVAKLFSLIHPARAYFGEKDWQQLTLVRRMVADLDLGVEIIGVPTVRERDGLALSSRNVYLSADERRQALVLAQALRAGAEAPSGSTLVAARDALQGLDVDYLELRAGDLSDAPPRGVARLLVAARVGSTRLIDNIKVQL